MNRSPWPWILVGLLLIGPGCAKRVPSPDLKFESHQKVILTMQGGVEVEGRLAKGNRITMREGGVTWTGLVGNLTDEEIVLNDLVQVRTDKEVALQVSRTADAQVAKGDPVPERRFPRSEIAKVDFVRMDVGKTARTAGFWTYGAVVLSLLMGERS
jgi:hypothetical protein